MTEMVIQPLLIHRTVFAVKWQQKQLRKRLQTKKINKKISNTKLLYWYFARHPVHLLAFGCEINNYAVTIKLLDIKTFSLFNDSCILRLHAANVST